MTKDCAEIIDFLIYASYRFNRNHSPEISPELWATVFINADKLEALYQKELAELTLADVINQAKLPENKVNHT